MNKDEILAKFSSEPDRYYKIKLFEEQGFARKSCVTCKRFFWTLDSNRVACPDHADDTYSFIGNPPTSKRFDYTEAWKQVESFFVKNGHTSISRYPVVCRWRDDLYFTIASIVDFQRVMGSKVVFEFPANPLVVPQTCLRFKDIENVGVTGRHFSSFCMIGQHSIPNNKGYWKDECVDLDYRLLTESFGINKNEITFVEDVWAGGGSFGSSLEYYVRGLELGNAVFTEFQGELGNHTTLDQKIIDMGAGLERFAWITMGTPTAYDCCFGPITQKLFQKIGLDTDSVKLTKYFTEIARNLEKFQDLSQVRKAAIKASHLSERDLVKMITPLEGLYMIADHLRTLIFAISDGALPSNVGGGYNLRIILRRIMATIDRLGLKLDLDELIDSHIDYLKKTYPELEQYRAEVKTIIGIEVGRYHESKSRMEKIAQNLKSQKKTLNVDDMIRLYESDGVTPDYLKEYDVISEIPDSFYSKLSDLHQSEKKKTTEEFDLAGIPETDLLFYKDDPVKFDAKVLKVIKNKFVILDRTSFYARGGGQEPDHGKINGQDVIDVTKHGNVVLHEIKGISPKEGDIIPCEIEESRRANITKHHTSTHVVNSSARNVLGSWVWQHSAFKEKDYGRLDITHHSSLSDEEVRKIESFANGVIQKNLPVTIQEYERGQAEQTFGFRIYQGGVVPVKSVRIVKIEDFDVEACGGTHVKRTGELGLIKITKSERIQDGVIRLEFVSGQAAIDFVQKQEGDVMSIIKLLGSNREKLVKSFEHAMTDSEYTKKKLKQLIKRTSTTSAKQAIEASQNFGPVKFYHTVDEELDEEFHIAVGDEAIKQTPTLIYCALILKDSGIRIIVFAGEQAKFKAGDLVREISSKLGGSGGGDARFGQGGGKDTAKLADAIAHAESVIKKTVNL
ncbi:alanine--tRNA ligase [Candidatus Nitrosotenuis cloacae]|uniref:Alanine--tRNA ligase n=1 Tax=Candidatus Nitrosotenuis cloacae TaxID=1603555 RepID=A0A3G1B451_9ARCH|nr:alanine--tRNA ligase [Candidatus Nitrosotenuis cloacae]AJZ75693.1 alanyl-tRNA synthetase [Candidatus Nitrosotenuis cloacae]